MSNSSSDDEDAGDQDWGRFLKNRVCYKEIPGIINDKLLEELLRKQMEGDEAGRLLLEDGINFEKITEIRIEFCKILRIDHLWIMKNLKILKMDNNFIEKIENLESLTQLIELDLSFNKITKMENLDNLVNLEKLSLFDNLISEIENMENLKNLTIFSIGRNEISDWKNIIYLRRLPRLRSLNMADNPCCTVKDFRYFIATYLPNLQFYEYRAITTIERSIGDEIFHDDYLFMLEKEKIELGNKYRQEKEEFDAQVNAESFVEYLNTRKLFESFFENDPEGSAFLLMGGEVKKLYVTYEENIVGICKDIFRMGQMQHDTRQENLREFENSVKQIHQQNQTEAITNTFCSMGFWTNFDEIISQDGIACSDDYLFMLEKEKIELGNKYRQEKEEFDAQVNAESFVEYLNTRKLFESFFENDPEGSAFLLMGGEVKKLYVTYEENIVGICKDIFRMGQMQHDTRQENLREFENSVKQIHQQNQTEAIGYMEHFLEEKPVILENVRNISWQVTRIGDKEPKILLKQLRDLKEYFQELSNSLWKDLMKLESVLYEQMMELNETYEHALADLINNFIEQAQGMFVTMRDMVAEYNDGLQEIAQIYYATVVFEAEEAEKDRLEAEKKKKESESLLLASGRTKSVISERGIEEIEDESMEIKEEEIPRRRIPSILKPYVKDRDTLLNALAGSRDIHLLMVDNREDLLVSKAREWQQETVRILYENEIKRNRDKILEITHFLNVQDEEFKLLTSEMNDNLNKVVSSEEI